MHTVRDKYLTFSSTKREGEPKAGEMKREPESEGNGVGFPQVDEKSNFKFSIANQEVITVGESSAKKTPEFSFLRSINKNFKKEGELQNSVFSNSKSPFRIGSNAGTHDSSSKDPFFDFFAKSMQRLYSLGLDKSMTKGIPIFDSNSGSKKGTQLKKRKRGRPRKHPLKKKKVKTQITPFNDSELSSDQMKNKAIVIKTKIGDEFYSDAEDELIEKISILNNDDEEKEVPKELNVSFARKSKLQVHPKEQTKILKKQKNRLFLAKLLNAIQEQENRNSVKRFMCRFCGKTFDKPSSLGGHTAKKHNGLSRKYKKRLDAAKNRKTERDRNNFIKKKLVEEMKNKKGA